MFTKVFQSKQLLESNQKLIYRYIFFLTVNRKYGKKTKYTKKKKKRKYRKPNIPYYTEKKSKLPLHQTYRM